MSSFAIDADALARARTAGHVNTQGEAGTRVSHLYPHPLAKTRPSHVNTQGEAGTRVGLS